MVAQIGVMKHAQPSSAQYSPIERMELQRQIDFLHVVRDRKRDVAGRREKVRPSVHTRTSHEIRHPGGVLFGVWDELATVIDRRADDGSRRQRFADGNCSRKIVEIYRIRIIVETRNDFVRGRRNESVSSSTRTHARLAHEH